MKLTKYTVTVSLDTLADTPKRAATDFSRFLLEEAKHLKYRVVDNATGESFWADLDEGDQP